MPHRPPILGLIGGVGGGKSLVAQMLAQEGCVVSDSDALARESFQDPQVRERLRAWWGPRAFRADGSVDRAAVAAIVFADPAERARLESVVHPWIARRREAQFAAASPTAPALVIDAPLLLEAGLDAACDRVIFVDSRLEDRLQRVRDSRGWDAAELARREAAQWPLDRKRAAAHHVLRNDGSPESLRAQVRAVLQEIGRAQPPIR
ncbi:MAG: dephospho-CoA kinase [Phycisphaerales bacterium]